MMMKSSWHAWKTNDSKIRAGRNWLCHLIYSQLPGEDFPAETQWNHTWKLLVWIKEGLLFCFVGVFCCCCFIFKENVGQNVQFMRHTSQYRFSLTLMNKKLPYSVHFNHFLNQPDISFLFFLWSSLFKCLLYCFM